MIRILILAAKLTSSSSLGSTSEQRGSFAAFAAHFAVRMATMSAVAIIMDGPSFGQSGLRSWPTTLICRA